MKSTQRRLAAIMFTDMEGYTALMQQDEVQAKIWRSKHREVLQQSHEHFQGEILEYFGDGTLSIFQSAVNAVKCAIHIQTEMRGKPEIPLRIGIHLGDIVYNQEEVFGDGVNIASRIESFSVPGAVLISETVFEQMQNQPDFKAISLGKFRFKNVNRPTEIFAVVNQGIVVPEGRELRGKGHHIDSERDNLPRQLTSFIGREKEIEEILELIKQTRLITLTGPGGTGKTRLALAVAENLIEHIRGKLYWVSLAPVTEAESVILTIAKTLELVQNPSKNTTDLVIEFLKNKDSFLFLDNFEQVMGAIPMVRQILENCPHVKILVTSRTVLNLQEEREYPLRPLPLPELNGKQGATQLMDYPSINLFYERARAARPGFTVNETNVVEVAMICQRLDGLPLAIELAAARIKLFSPGALLKRLDQRLDLLKADNPDRPERHHTLRQTINWSYELLTPTEQKLFQRLSVFSGGSNLEAIESICCQGDIDPLDVIDQMFALVSKSLITKEEDLHGEPRFYMLQTIRAFAGEISDLQEEIQTIRQGHALFFVKKAEELAPQLTGPEQSHWVSVLEEDLDNFRVAINWAIRQNEFNQAFRLGTALWRFWVNRGLLTEGVSLAHRLLEWQVPSEFLPLRVKIAEALSATYFYTGDYHLAVPICEDNLSFWRNLGKEKEIANNLNHLGFACVNSGLVDEGIEYSREALEMHNKSGDLRGQAVSLNNIGWAYSNAGNPQEASLHLEQSLDLRRRSNDERGIGFALVNLARTYGMIGKEEDALVMLEDGLEILEKIKDKIVFYWGTLIKAQLYYEMGEMEKLSKLLESSRDKIFTVSLAFTLNGWADFLEGLLASYRGSFKQADHCIQKGIEVFQERRMVYFMSKGWYYRGKVALDTGVVDTAWRYLESSLKINHQYNNDLGLAENMELAGILMTHSGDKDKAGILLTHAEQIRTQLHAPTPHIMKSYISESWSQLEKEISPERLEEIRKEGCEMNRDQVLTLISATERNPNYS